MSDSNNIMWAAIRASLRESFDMDNRTKGNSYYLTSTLNSQLKPGCEPNKTNASQNDAIPTSFRTANSLNIDASASNVNMTRADPNSQMIDPSASNINQFSSCTISNLAKALIHQQIAALRTQQGVLAEKMKLVSGGNNITAAVAQALATTQKNAYATAHQTHEGVSTTIDSIHGRKRSAPITCPQAMDAPAKKQRNQEPVALQTSIPSQDNISARIKLFGEQLGLSSTNSFQNNDTISCAHATANENSTSARIVTSDTSTAQENLDLYLTAAESLLYLANSDGTGGKRKKDCEPSAPFKSAKEDKKSAPAVEAPPKKVTAESMLKVGWRRDVIKKEEGEEIISWLTPKTSMRFFDFNDAMEFETLRVKHQKDEGAAWVEYAKNKPSVVSFTRLLGTQWRQRGKNNRRCWVSPTRHIKFKVLDDAVLFEDLRKKFGEDEVNAWVEFSKLKIGRQLPRKVITASRHDHILGSRDKFIRLVYKHL